MWIDHWSHRYGARPAKRKRDKPTVPPRALGLFGASAHTPSAPSLPSVLAFPLTTAWHRRLFGEGGCALCIVTKEAKQVQEASPERQLRQQLSPGNTWPEWQFLAWRQVLPDVSANALLNYPSRFALSPAQAGKVRWSLTPRGTLLTTVSWVSACTGMSGIREGLSWNAGYHGHAHPSACVGRRPSSMERQEMQWVSSRTLAGITLPGMNLSSSIISYVTLCVLRNLCTQYSHP